MSGTHVTYNLDAGRPIRFNYQVLEELYERLRKNPDDNLDGLQLFHSSVGYAVASVEGLFNKRYTYREMAMMMVEEGMTVESGRPVKLEDLVSNLSQREKQLGFDLGDDPC